MKKIDLLQSFPLFWDFQRRTGHIADKMVSSHFENGNYIFLEDSEGEKCFFVVEGSVKVTRLSKDGREVILTIMNPGDFFGEMSYWMVNHVCKCYCIRKNRGAYIKS
ncbi:hypothetical protein Ct9H90mP29_05190 [bacterium]|nr:MAG: hypothetical protein Ct9H90mP29_05190 [bacterium]